MTFSASAYSGLSRGWVKATQSILVKPLCIKLFARAIFSGVRILGKATGPSLGLVSTIVTSAIDLTKPKLVSSLIWAFDVLLKLAPDRGQFTVSCIHTSPVRDTPGPDPIWFHGTSLASLFATNGPSHPRG
jgi:hypothetical protein